MWKYTYETEFWKWFVTVSLSVLLFENLKATLNDTIFNSFIMSMISVFGTNHPIASMKNWKIIASLRIGLDYFFKLLQHAYVEKN